MTLDEAREAFELNREVHPMVGNYAFCATGEPYIQVLSGGTMEECGAGAEVFSAEDAAISAWLEAAFDYAKDKLGTVYWRVPPVLETYGGKYVVYSRLVISDKPPIQLQCTTSR